MSEVFAAQEAIIQDGRNKNLQMAPSLTSFLRHNGDIWSISCSSKHLIMWAKTWQKHCNNAASYFARPGRMCTNCKMFCSSKLFVLFSKRWLIGLIALVFLSFFILLLNLQTFSAASRDNVFVLIVQKMIMRHQKLSTKLVFADSLCPLVNINSVQRGERARGIQAS